MTTKQIQTNQDGKINLAIEQSTSNYLYHYTSNLGLMGLLRKIVSGFQEQIF